MWRNLLAVLFLKCNVVLEFFGSRPIHMYNEIFTRVECRVRRERERAIVIESKETDSVLFCGCLLWNISVARTKRLID